MACNCTTTTVTTTTPPPGSDCCLQVRYTCEIIGGESTWVLDVVNTDCIDNDLCAAFYESCSDTEYVYQRQDSCVCADPLPVLPTPTCDPNCPDGPTGTTTSSTSSTTSTTTPPPLNCPCEFAAIPASLTVFGTDCTTYGGSYTFTAGGGCNMLYQGAPGIFVVLTYNAGSYDVQLTDTNPGGGTLCTGSVLLDCNTGTIEGPAWPFSNPCGLDTSCNGQLGP